VDRNKAQYYSEIKATEQQLIAIILEIFYVHERKAVKTLKGF